jgi:hypothetical protein
MAHAQSTGPSSVREYLLGTWSPRCEAAPSAGAVLAVFFALPEDERLFLLPVVRSGATVDADEIVGVRILPSTEPGRAAVVFEHSKGRVNQTILDVTRLNAYSVISSIGSDGTVYTRQGIDTKTGAPAVVYQRCSKAAAR